MQYKDEKLNREVIPLPDSKLVLIPFEYITEAHYVCALLNSAISRMIVRSYVVGTQISTHVLRHIALPKYDSRKSSHNDLAVYSRLCHDATATGDEDTIAALESEIDKAAAQLWGITDDELKAIQDALLEMAKPKRGSNKARI